MFLGIMASAKKSDLMKFKIWHCELIQKAIREQSIKAGPTVTLLADNYVGHYDYHNII